MSDRGDGEDARIDASPVTPGDVYCPLVTPFEEDGALDTDALCDLVDHLIDAGVDGFVPCGTTGEFAALTDEERRTVVETTVEAADGRVPVLAGVGGTAPASVRGRIAAADAAGADAAVVVAPYYGPSVDRAGTEAFYRAVLADCRLPAFLYDVPVAAGQSLSTDAVVALADRDAVVGLKDSSGDLSAFAERRRRTPDEFVLLQGWDGQFVPGLCVGADGGINALSHFVPETLAAAADAVAAGDLERARRLQFEGIDVPFGAFADAGFAASIKAVLADRGIIRSAAVRPPATELGAEERRTVFAAVEGAESRDR